MVNIPSEFTQNIVQIIEWHLETYVPDKLFDAHLKRILECFFERRLVDGSAQITKNDLYYLNECLSNATNNILECGVGEKAVWDIYNWIVAKRKKENI